MFRARTLRFLIQRLGILCLFGCVFVWFYLHSESRSKTILVLSETERLDGGISRSVKRHDAIKDFQASSIVARNVFGIRPVATSSRSYFNEGKKDKGIIQFGADLSDSGSFDKKYMFVFHHHEQFGKTTENFVQLCAIAAYGSRTVVEPFVRDSRMCGLETGWWGESLTKSRLFRPLSTYFDVNTMNDLLSQNGYATVQPFSEFKYACNKSTVNLTLVHFLYKDGKDSTMKWFNISESQYYDIFIKSKTTGWTNCPILEGLNVSQRLGGLRTGKQICVNAESVVNHKMFEDRILMGDKCVVIIFWKGFGSERTHFKPEVKLKARQIVHRFRHSNIIIQEAELFKKVFLEKPFIAVHVRSERQILWYSAHSLLKCIDLLIKTVTKLKQKQKINTVFLATDLSQYGSDTLVPKIPSGLKDFENRLIDGLSPKRYNPNTKDPLLRDHGVVAIVEMNILSYAEHLVTLGSGSFQEWVMAVFMDRKKDTKKYWTISRVCSKEKKNHNAE